jgi:hypothetical protein
VLAGAMLQQCSSAQHDPSARVLSLPIDRTPVAVFQGITATVQAMQGALGVQLDAAAAALPGGAKDSGQLLLSAVAAATGSCSEELDQSLSAGMASIDNACSSSSSSSNSNDGPPVALICLQEVDKVAAAAAAVPGQQQLAQQLQAFGKAVCAVSPTSQCCNNPSCSSRAQLSEAALVGGKSSRCSSCKVARYCSRECQVS